MSVTIQSFNHTLSFPEAFFPTPVLSALQNLRPDQFLLSPEGKPVPVHYVEATLKAASGAWDSLRSCALMIIGEGAVAEVNGQRSSFPGHSLTGIHRHTHPESALAANYDQSNCLLPIHLRFHPPEEPAEYVWNGRFVRPALAEFLEWGQKPGGGEQRDILLDARGRRVVAIDGNPADATTAAFKICSYHIQDPRPLTRPEGRSKPARFDWHGCLLLAAA